MSPANQDLAGVGRRRVPRRTFEAAVGVLLHGKYSVQRAYQVGEGGMMVSTKAASLKEGEMLGLSFYLPAGMLVMVRGMVRSVIPAKGDLPERYGIEFENVGFQQKREIRNFVAAATRGDGHLMV